MYSKIKVIKREASPIIPNSEDWTYAINWHGTKTIPNKSRGHQEKLYRHDMWLNFLDNIGVDQLLRKVHDLTWAMKMGEDPRICQKLDLELQEIIDQVRNPDVIEKKSGNELVGEASANGSRPSDFKGIQV